MSDWFNEIDNLTAEKLVKEVEAGRLELVGYTKLPLQEVVVQCACCGTRSLTRITRAEWLAAPSGNARPAHEAREISSEGGAPTFPAWTGQQAAELRMLYYASKEQVYKLRAEDNPGSQYRADYLERNMKALVSFMELPGIPLPPAPEAQETSAEGGDE